MKTSGYVMQGLPNPDGHVFIGISPASSTANPGTRTRTGPGLVPTVQAANTASIYEISITELLFRYGMQDDSQMLFGRNNATSGANALALNPGVINQSPYSNQPRPPYPSSTVFGTAGNSLAIAKGIQINALSLVYQTLGAALTSASIGITKTQFVSGAAPVVSNILANANNGIVLNVAAQPVITSIAIPNPVMLTSKFAQYVIELDTTTAAGGTLNLFGIYLDLAYNFN